jgi:hypothetical protein
MIVMKAYVTCPISHTRNRLSTLPVIKTIEGGSPKAIFDRDYSNIKSSDILIAEVSERSHGVGIEIGLSYELGLKRILLLEKGNTVSKLVMGMPNTKIIEYKNIKELQTKLHSELENIIKK